MNKKIYILAITLTLIAVFQLLYFPRLIADEKTKQGTNMKSAIYSPIYTSATTAMSDDGKFEYYVGEFDCPIKGFSETGEGVLDTYTVKSGDSLLSIVNNIYEDSTKVADLVYLNKYRYNSLSTGSSFIEIGWELLLPEPDISVTAEGFEIASGNIRSMHDGQIILMTSENSAAHHFYPNHLTKVLPDLKLGDCVNIFHRTHNTVYKVELQ